MQSFGLVNVNSKSSQPLNEVTCEVGCYSESSSIQLSHFNESLKKLLIAINLPQQQNLLITVVSTWLTDEDGDNYVMMTGDDTDVENMTVETGPDGTQTDVSSLLTVTLIFVI